NREAVSTQSPGLLQPWVERGFVFQPQGGCDVLRFSVSLLFGSALLHRFLRHNPRCCHSRITRRNPVGVGTFRSCSQGCPKRQPWALGRNRFAVVRRGWRFSLAVVRRGWRFSLAVVLRGWRLSFAVGFVVLMGHRA